ncbi:hypothetical protein HDU67_004450, partial [Dinochytrium kinnereticum]
GKGKPGAERAQGHGTLLRAQRLAQVAKGDALGGVEKLPVTETPGRGSSRRYEGETEGSAADLVEDPTVAG